MYSLKNKRQSEQTGSPDKYPQQYFKEKGCRKCGTVFQPKAPSHLYCSDECADHCLKDAYLKRNYGIDYNMYLEMLKEQDNKCFLCKEEGFVMDKLKHKLKLVVDHCHESGTVRKLLCHNCNRALGLFKDKPEVIQSAVDYIREYKKGRSWNETH